MNIIALVVIARILHVVSSVIWAGFVIVAGLILVKTPLDMQPENARRIRQNVVSRVSGVVASSALISLLSGLYLYSSLHAGARSPTEIALGIGAISAVLSFLVGAIGSGQAERQLAKLDSLSTRSAIETAKIVSLNR